VVCDGESCTETGLSGTFAARIYTKAESKLKPTLFLERTLKE
jgi:hypothetical protein